MLSRVGRSRGSILPPAACQRLAWPGVPNSLAQPQRVTTLRASHVQGEARLGDKGLLCLRIRKDLARQGKAGACRIENWDLPLHKALWVLGVELPLEKEGLFRGQKRGTFYKTHPGRGAEVR